MTAEGVRLTPGPAGRGAGRRDVAAGLAITAAGAAIGAALVLRWQRCVGAVGGYEAVPCTGVQDHAYDYLLPAEPWVAIPGAAQLEGVAHLLLAVGILLCTGRVPVGTAGRVLSRALAGALVVVGGLTLVSGVVASTLPVSLPLQLVWGLLGPVLLAAVAVLMGASPVRDRRTPYAVAVLAVLALTMPWQESAVFALVVPSSGTPPWTGSIRAVGLVVLGALIAAAGARGRR